LSTDNETTNAIMAKLAQSQSSYAKGMEMIGVFSAGTIGVVVALQPAGHEKLEIKLAIILLFIAVLTTIFWFMGKGSQYFKVARLAMSNPDSEISVKEYWWARTSRVLALSSFVGAYYFLFQSL